MARPETKPPIIGHAMWPLSYIRGHWLVIKAFLLLTPPKTIYVSLNSTVAVIATILPMNMKHSDLA